MGNVLGLTGVMAHFVHRWYTFDSHKSIAWTLPTAVPVYGEFVRFEFNDRMVVRTLSESNRMVGSSQSFVLGHHYLVNDEGLCVPVFVA